MQISFRKVILASAMLTFSAGMIRFIWDGSSSLEATLASIFLLFLSKEFD